MKTETAKEVLKDTLIDNWNGDFYQMIITDGYEDILVEIMIKYAKAKVNERDNLLQDYADEIGNEIAVQIVIEKAKKPDFT